MDATIKKQLNDNHEQLPPPKSQRPDKGYQSTICYHTLVRPTLEYVLAVWHGVHIPHQTTTSCKELNQTRAARDGLVIGAYKLNHPVAIDDRINGPLAVLIPGRKNSQTLARVHCVTYKPIDIPGEVYLNTTKLVLHSRCISPSYIRLGIRPLPELTTPRIIPI